MVQQAITVLAGSVAQNMRLGLNRIMEVNMPQEELQAEVAHLRRRLAEAATLLEALANSDNNRSRTCEWCTLISKFSVRPKPSEHDADCPIRLASEWLQV